MSLVSDRLFEIRRATMPDAPRSDFADYIGLGPQVYSKYESGEERVPLAIISDISSRIGLPEEIVDGTAQFDDFYKTICRLLFKES